MVIRLPQNFSGQVKEITEEERCVSVANNAAQLYRADNLKILKTINDRQFDAVITDPPYNRGVDYNTYDDNRDPEEYKQWCKTWLVECERVCSGSVCIAVGPQNMSMWFSIKEPTWVIGWFKNSGAGYSPIGFCHWEPIFMYGQSKGLRCPDVIVASTGSISTDLEFHPCPKPIGWATGLIEMVTQPDMLVLDLFMGSGTVGIACAETRRRFFGIELDPNYFAGAHRRIDVAFNGKKSWFNKSTTKTPKKIKGFED